MKDQIKLLNDLAVKIEATKKTKQQSIETLISAGILNKKGKLTAHYASLGRQMSKSGK